MSIDIPNITPVHHSQELSFNNQDSIVEFFLEKVLGYENAVEEFESNSDDFKQKSDLDIELIAIKSSFFKIKCLLTKVSKQKYPELTPQVTQGYLQLDTPPPKYC